MQGYDPAQAAKAIAQNIDRKQYAAFSAEFDSLIRQAVDLDLAYMRASGVIAEDGMSGAAYYDDDEAFEYILDGIARARGWDDERTLRLGALIDDYMDAQQNYMESIGMLEWD